MTITTIAQYRLEDSLGAGRHTETYHAFDLVRRRPVALKLLQPNLIPGEATGRAFLAQAMHASDLVHPRIAWVWETGEAEGRFFLTERFVAGESLAARLMRAGPLPWDQAMQILEQIAQAVEFAEERGWRHGRVTPHNILLGSDMGAVLSDYGLENAVRQIFPGAAPSIYDARYLPPEILHSQPITPRADLYMLACTLVEMVLGKNPFAADSLAEIESLKTAAQAQLLLPFSSTPAGAEQVVKRALSSDPSDRFDSALEFVDALRRAVSLGSTDAAARAQHAEQVRLWREAEEKTRLEGEEAARLAALELARREIQERAGLEAELAIEAAEGYPLEPEQAAPEGSSSPPSRRVPARQRMRSGPDLRRFWPIFLGIALLALALGGYWLNGRGSLAGGVQPSPTSSVGVPSTPLVILPTAAPTATTAPSRTPTASPSARPSFTPSRTASRTPSPVPSRTPTASPSDTAAPPVPTSTLVRPDRDDRIGGGP